MHSQTGIDYPISLTNCGFCKRIRDRYGRVPCVQSPNMPVYVGLLPINLTIPHICCLHTIKTVEYLYLGKRISRQLYDEWMKAIGGRYQICGSQELMQLWDDRICELNGNKSARIRKIQKKHLLTYDKDKFDELFDDNYFYKVRHINCDKVCYLQIKSKLMTCRTRNIYKIVNKFYPFTADSDKNKTNIDFCSLFISLTNKYKINQINDFLFYLPIGIYNSVAVALAVHYFGNDCAHKVFKLMSEDGAYLLTALSLNKYLKCISTAIRRSQMWPNGNEASLDDVTQCSYWELCIGRSIMKSKWEQEYENRIITKLPLKLPHHYEANEHTDAIYRSRLKIHLEAIISELISIDMKHPTYAEFVLDRQKWISSGSSGGQHFTYKDKTYSMDKRFLFEVLTKEEMLEWPKTLPKILGRGSEKFEQSKARAIYATKVVDYVLMSYVIHRIEPRLANINGVEGGLTGIDELRCIIRRSNAMKSLVCECSMADYADFNRQHTLDAQGMVFDAVRDRLQEMRANADIIHCADWCAKALRNQWVVFPHVSGEHKVVQGLFSGVRGTNFINTILNVAYYRVAEELCINDYGLRSDVLNLHQGDDVWISSDSRLMNITTYNVLKACGFDLSDSKQMQGTNVGEFLRVMYHKDGSKGFLARALGTFIERPLQAEIDVTPSARATGINSQIMVLYRRGLDLSMCTLIWNTIIKYHLTSHIGDGNVAHIPIKLAQLPYLDNGLDIGPPMTMAKPQLQLPKLPRMKFESKSLTEGVPSNMSHDWIIKVSREFAKPMDSVKLEASLHKANLMGSAPVSVKKSARNQLHKELRLWNDKASKIQQKEVSMRNSDNFKSWLLEEEENIYVKALINDIYKYSVKKVDRKLGLLPLQHIFKAIAASTFKDIHNAEIALGLNTIEAATACIGLCSKQELRLKAIQYLNYLRLHLGDEVVASILRGERASGPTFEALFNPIPLSVLCNFSTCLATEFAVQNSIKNINRWRELLTKTHLTAMATAIRDGRLLQISKY